MTKADLVTPYEVKLHAERVACCSPKGIDQRVNSCSEAARVARTIIGKRDRECILVFYLDNHMNLTGGFEVVAVGSGNCVASIPREVFRGAILAACRGIVIVHNHPGGSVAPSKEDVGFHKLMEDAGRILGVEVLDSIVVSREGYRSVKQCG